MLRQVGCGDKLNWGDACSYPKISDLLLLQINEPHGQRLSRWLWQDMGKKDIYEKGIFLFDALARCPGTVDMAGLLTEIEAVIRRQVGLNDHAAATRGVTNSLRTVDGGNFPGIAPARREARLTKKCGRASFAARRFPGSFTGVGDCNPGFVTAWSRHM